jgi:hypothetical protein
MSHQSDLIATDIDAYLKQHEHKEMLRFLTCGSVDDGKSTLIGMLLYETKISSRPWNVTASPTAPPAATSIRPC